MLEADLPGFKKEDIKIDLENDRLTISATRHSEHEENKNGCIRRERHFGTFERSFDVRRHRDAEHQGQLPDGVLTLTLPKRPELVPDNRSISIE